MEKVGAGIATIDTARGYGESEALLGASFRAMRSQGSSDDALRVITKLDPNISLPGDTAAKAIARLGLRSRPPRLKSLRLLDQRLARSGFFEAAREAGQRVYVRSVFMQGVAFIPPSQLPQHLLGFAQPLGKIRGLASALGCRIEQLFLAYAATLPDVTAIVGCESSAQLRGLIEAQTSGQEPSIESIRRLANHIAPLPDRLLDPSQWTRELPAGRVVKTARSRASVLTSVPGAA